MKQGLSHLQHLVRMDYLGVLEKYEANMESAWQNTGVIAAFTWADTEEGHKFWNKINYSENELIRLIEGDYYE